MSLAPPKPSLMPGHRLDRYELLALIAEGGMGQVWLARMVGKHGFEKLVAVKTLLPKYAEDLKFQQMFLDEARIASGIEHANVAQILDLGEQNDVLYLVMELVDGESLSKLTRAVAKAKIGFPIPIGLRIIADTCGGIHVAHELRGADGHALGIVHRDVSPQNILITTTGVSKLIDFGIAKARDRYAGETSEGILKGKIHYMAPEQALGRKLDRRADVFALGAILYLLFAGKPAYDGESQLEILHLLTSGRPPLPLPAAVPKPVNDLVRKALAAAADERFQTALELQRAINVVMAECKLFADTSDVAAFVEVHLGARAKKRREGIEVALKAAAERAAMNATLLQPTSSKSSPGTNVPLVSNTPAPISTSETPPPQQRHGGSVSEVQAVAMRASSGKAEEIAGLPPKRGNTGRVIFLGATVLALVAGIAIVATRAVRPVAKEMPAANGRAAAALLASTAPPEHTPQPPPTATELSTADSTGEATDEDAGASHARTSTAGHTKAATPHPARHVKPAATAATATAPASAPRPPQSNVPDFGY